MSSVKQEKRERCVKLFKQMQASRYFKKGTFVNMCMRTKKTAQKRKGRAAARLK